MSAIKTTLATIGVLALLAPSASAQGVAFQPGISSFPNGVSLPVTPAISIHGEYLRAGLNPQFSQLNGFNTFSVPAAVSGGGTVGNFGGAFGFPGMNGPNVVYGDAMVPTYQPDPLDFSVAAPAYKGMRTTPGPQVGAAHKKTARSRRGRPKP